MPAFERDLERTQRQGWATDAEEAELGVRCVAAPVREVIQRGYQHLTDPLARGNAAAEENVLFAIENLETYPAVRARLANGSLHLHGWVFNIATAELFAYNPETKQFEPLSQPAS